MKKRLLATFIISSILTLVFATTAFAGIWKQDSIGWWWQREDGSYPMNGWEWIDGNGDNISECYYFDHSGYCLMNTQTPDGYQVDENGAWVVNSVVQTKATPKQSAVSTSQKAGISSCYIETSQQETISYLLYTPENATENMPLIVFLNGHGQFKGLDGRDISSYKTNRHVSALLKEAGNLSSAYIIAPVLPPKYDNNTHKMWLKIEDSLLELIEAEVQSKKIDRNKISVFGISMGGDAAIQIAQKHPDLFSCLTLSVPFHKNPIREWNSSWSENLSTVPVWLLLEDAKDVLNMATEMQEDVTAAGGQVWIDIIKGADHGTAAKTITASLSSDKLNILNWMVSVSRPQQ